MVSEPLLALRRERRALHRECLVLCAEFASAHVAGSPRASDLRETMDRLYDQLAALDMAIASYDPQIGLFPDAHA